MDWGEKSQMTFPGIIDSKSADAQDGLAFGFEQLEDMYFFQRHTSEYPSYIYIYL